MEFRVSHTTRKYESDTDLQENGNGNHSQFSLYGVYICPVTRNFAG